MMLLQLLHSIDLGIIVAHLHTVFAHVSDAALTVLAPLAAPKKATGDAYKDIENFASNIRSFLTTLGGIVFGIGVAVAGIMRMTAFGSERRVAMSNMALTAAVVGLVIVVMANTLDKLITNAFEYTTK
ncbi:hypothetical protein KTH_48070 [Thermosporothrix hazakensis]|nr:hypothetical protein KTH_48070 [Thermosporothrix hazakensis]